MTRPRIFAGIAAPLVATFFLAAPRRAGAATGFADPRAGDRLAAGSELRVRWRRDASREAEGDELELVLSLDGGATFPVRVSGRVAPDDDAAVIRVPNLPSEHVRLALREGDDEESESEHIVLVSEPFAIDGSERPDRDSLFPVGGEWRTAEALEGAPVPTAAATWRRADVEGDAPISDEVALASDPTLSAGPSPGREPAFVLERTRPMTEARAAGAGEIHRVPSKPLRV